MGSNVSAAAGLLLGAASFTPLMAAPSPASCIALQACMVRVRVRPNPNPKPNSDPTPNPNPNPNPNQACMVLYIFGRAVCMVPAQVQSLEPFPTRAASAAGLAGAIRMATVSLVGLFAAVLDSGTPQADG